MGEYRRPHYNLMLSRLSERRKCIFVLAGPRQVGKSTVMAQIAETIDKVVFQFNADSVNEEDSDWIRRSWESVRSRMDIQHLQEAVLVIDEIQKIRRWSDNSFNYIERKYYSVKREGNVAFELVPVDGSTKMQDELMESIEPFDFKDAVDFQTAYLSGYLADRYDVSAEDSIARANERIKRTTQQIFDSTVNGYDSFSRESGNIKLNNGKAKYALYPVWLLNTTWNGNKYTFAMNGQTGKFVGDLPVDSGAATKWFFAIAAGVTAVCFGISMLLGL